MLSDEQLLRYNRHILLPQIDIEGQERLLQSRVMIVGLGGLGSPVALYLAASGVGAMTLVDFDRVDSSNLQRQIIHRQSDEGYLKVESARNQCQAINVELQVETIATALSEAEVLALAETHDVIIDCTDNFSTRFMLNRVSVVSATPLVSGAAIRCEGQVSVFDPSVLSPCYRCLYPEVEASEMEESCVHSGVLSPLVGIIGSIQAAECIKLLASAGESLSGRLLIIDALSMRFREVRLKRDPGCEVCGRSINDS